MTTENKQKTRLTASQKNAQELSFSEEEKNFFMQKALVLAKKAFDAGEVPVGAIIVDENKQIIGEGYNQREETQNPLYHAEMIAINEASKHLKTWRLEKATMFVTLEPCAMCSGAIIHSRIPYLIYGADDTKTGAVNSLYKLLSDERLNHQVNVEKGILEDECSCELKIFFKNIRMRKKALKNGKETTNK